MRAAINDFPKSGFCKGTLVYTLAIHASDVTWENVLVQLNSVINKHYRDIS